MESRQTSWVWKFAILSDDRKRAICNLCDKSISYNSSPSAIANHLKQIHKKTCNDACEDTLRETSNTDEGEGVSSQSYSTPRKRRRLNNGSENCPAQRQEMITEAVATLIATNQLPISIVCSPGFKNFMSIVEPGYRIPCEKTIVKRLEVLYDKVKAKVTKDLQEAKSVSLSVDEWTSRAQESFISVEAQYIDTNLRLKHVTLSNDSLDGRPNAANIASEMKNVIQGWNLDSKVKAVVHDSASVMNAACNILEEADDNINCSAHILQLAVKDALAMVPEFEEVCTKERSIVRHFRKSNVASKALSERQKQQNLKQKRLKQSVETRWNSEFFMCESLFENRGPITLVLSDRSITKPSTAKNLELIEEEWTSMENMMKVLKPFQVTTTIFCSESQVTLSMVRPIISNIITKHMLVAPTDDDLIKKFKLAAIASLETRFNIKTNDEDDNQNVEDEVTAYHIAEFLDPRYKSLVHETARMKSKLKNYIQSFLGAGERMDTDPATNENANRSNNSATALDYLFQVDVSEKSWKDQYDSYLAEPVPSLNSDPLEWWSKRSKQYPALLKLVYIYLAIPATSAASERTFSSAGNIVTPKRSSLNAENVNILTFLYQNRHLMLEDDL